MVFRYPWLSKGFLGLKNNAETLNSCFFRVILNNISLLNSDLIFTQRVPRKDFFNELSFFETSLFGQELATTLNKIKQKHIQLYKSEKINKENFPLILNLEKLLIRYSQFDYLLTSSFPHFLTKENRLQIEFTRCSAQLYQSLTQPKKIPWNKFKKIINEIITEGLVVNPIYLAIISNYIVYCYRYRAPTSYQHHAYKVSKLISKHIASIKPSAFFDCHVHSICYRGLAMVGEHSDSIKHSHIESMCHLLEKMNPNTKLENIVFRENQLTSNQTLAKWHLYNGNLSLAEETLHKMIKIDQYDSTGYTELAHFYFKKKQFKCAANIYQEAINKGPPGIGMNYYFLGICEYHQGNLSNAIKFLEKSSKSDPLGVSALKALMSIYWEQQDTPKTRDIVDKILNNPNLKVQLTQNEIKKLKSYL